MKSLAAGDKSGAVNGIGELVKQMESRLEEKFNKRVAELMTATATAPP